KPPFAYFVPQQQRDPVAAVELLRRLAFGGVRVSQLTDAITVSGENLPAGTWVVPTDQEFAAMAREVLDVQHYPDLRQYPGGPPERPYDAAGWTLPLQMGVRVVVANDALGEADRAKMKPLGAAPVTAIKPAPYDAALAQDAAAFDSVPGKGFDDAPAAAAIVPPAGRISGSGPLLHLDAAQNNTYRAINRAWQQGAKVYAHNGFAIGGWAEGQQDPRAAPLALLAHGIASGDAPLERERPRDGPYQARTGH